MDTVLKQIPLLADLSPAELTRLSQVVETLPLPAGSQLFAEGSLDRWLYFILSGEIELFKQTNAGEATVFIRSVGEWVGFMSLLDQSMHLKTARARSDCTLLAFPTAEFDDLLTRNARLAQRILQIVINRWRSDEFFSQQHALQAQAKRQQVEIRLQQLYRAIEHTTDRVLITDIDGLIQYVNPAFIKASGYSEAELIGQRPDKLKSGYHNQEFYQNLWENILSDHVFRAEFVNRHKDGSLFYEERTITPIHNPQGQLTHFVSVSRDISARRQAEAERAQIEAELRRHRDHLEEAVTQRTAALLEANARLQQEVSERQAIETALRQSEETLRRQNAYLAALHYTTLGLISHLDLDELLETIMSQVSQLLAAPHGFLWLLESDSNEMVLKIGFGVFHLDTDFRPNPNDGVTGQVRQTGQLHLINDYDNWIGRSKGIAKNVVQAVLGVPLKFGDRVVGILGAGYEAQAGRTFGPEEIELLSRFAQLASMALDNAQQVQHTQQALFETQALYRAGRALAQTSDPQRMLERALGEYLAALGLSQGGILVYNPDHQTGKMLALYREGQPQIAGMEIPLSSANYQINQSHRPLVVFDAINDPLLTETREFNRALNVKSILLVPLLVRGQVIGTLGADSTETYRHFSEREITLAQAMADQIATTIENMRLYTAAQEARHAAEAASQAKSQFLAHMSHELRTPLNGILGYTQILKKDQGLTGIQQDGIDIIQRSGEYLLTIINDILDLSKIEAGKMELDLTDFSLPGFFKSMVNLIRLRAEQKGLRFIYQPFDFTQDKPFDFTQDKPFDFTQDKPFDFTQDKPFDFTQDQPVDSTPNQSADTAPVYLPQYVRGDEKRLRQVLINLLGNAIKFTLTGQVTLKVGRVNADTINPSLLLNKATVSPQDNQRPYRLRFHVEDTGLGIPPEQIEAIFDPFQQGHHPLQFTEGTGLGLAISRSLVNLMGGELHVQSAPGQGSIFWFDLDLTEVTAAVRSTGGDEPKIVGYKGPKRRVLVIDDEEINRTLLVRLLTRRGFEVWSATGGREGLEQAYQLIPDAILIDMVMPEMDGQQVVRQFRQSPLLKDKIVIAISSSVFKDDQQASLASGCNAFVAKPVKVETLLAYLQQYLHLDWLYESKPESLPAQPEAALMPPPPATVAHLLELAMMGDVEAIQAQADQLAQTDPRFQPFTTELHRLAKGFQINKLCDFLQPYLPH